MKLKDFTATDAARLFKNKSTHVTEAVYRRVSVPSDSNALIDALRQRP